MVVTNLRTNKLEYPKKNRHGLVIRVSLAPLILALLILCCGIADAAAPSTWSKMYGGSKADQGYSVAALSDGYVVVGDTNSYTDNMTDVFVVRTDLSGNMQWYRTYGGGSNDFGSAVINDGGNIIVAGRKVGFHPYLIKIYPNGTLAWEKEYVFSDNLVTHSVARVGNYYVMVGQDITNMSIFLVKTKLNGDLVWIKYYGEGDHMLYGNSVIGITDGGINYYLITGSYRQSDEKDDVYLLKVKDDGTVIKKKIIGDAGINEVGNSAVASGSTIYIAGTAYNHSSFDDKVYVLRVDENLNKMWDDVYGGDLNVTGKSIIQVDSDLIIAGYTVNPYKDPYIARITWDGSLVRQYVKNVTLQQWIYSLVPASDGDYVIAGVGYPDELTPPDVYLAKIDSSVLDPTPTPAPSPSSAMAATPAPSDTPVAAPTEEPGPGPEPTDEPGSVPISNPVTTPTSVPTAGAEASATPVPNTGETVTPAASPTAQASGGDFSASSVVIIILLTIIATALVGIGAWLFLQKKK